MSINFLHLRSFYAVASERSVSRAARRLNISQPTLSKQLKALEERYKVKLIEGSRPPLTLTSAGQELFEKARQLFAVADEIGALLGEDDIDSGTLLRLGADSPPYAAEFMAAFKAAVPSAQFRVTIANALQTNELLLRAQVDIGIICEPTIQNDYTYAPIYSDRLVAIMPASWPDEGLAAFPLERLARETLLVRESTSRTLATVNRLLADAEIAPGRTMELHTREMIREAVAQGIGMSLMFEKECPPDSRIRVMPLDTRSSLIEIKGYLAVRTERKRMPLIRQALAIANQMSTM
ncbi:LysR family transcriptional regulator [Sphingomonas koreensis]|uniref:LysR family transcriptional regulator n=1 Tax=Sphingomonas koreensis TaxID=93064 RepID=UPI0013DFC50E|nr:LysR family transcriptional regulator [Sphingomonas koreensis]